MKLRIFALAIAMLMITAALVGCSSSGNNKAVDYQGEYDVPQPKPLTEEEITLVALQVTVPENSPYEAHKIDYELYTEVSDGSETSLDMKGDESIDIEAYTEYANKCNLEDRKVSDAAIEKIVVAVYGKDNYLFKFGGDKKIVLDDGRYGILKTVIVQPLDGNAQESFEILLTGKEKK